MNKIFISYRREDAADVTGRVNDRLRAKFGQDAIFTDVDSIPIGVDFREHLAHEVGQCDILLAVIGRRWIDIKDQSGQRRLDHATDFVRTEIESALKRKIPVVPLLAHGISMPTEDELPESIKPLAFRNGTTIRADPDFHKDVDRLIAGLEQFFAKQSEKPAENKEKIAAQTIDADSVADKKPGLDLSALKSELKAAKTNRELNAIGVKLAELENQEPDNKAIIALRKQFVNAAKTIKTDDTAASGSESKKPMLAYIATGLVGLTVIAGAWFYIDKLNRDNDLLNNQLQIRQEQERVAAEKRKAEVVADEKRKAAALEAERLAQEKRKATAAAEAKKLAQEKRKADIAAKEKRNSDAAIVAMREAALAKEKRLAEEKRKRAAEAEAKRLAVELARAEKLAKANAISKAKLDELRFAEAKRLAEEKRKADIAAAEEKRRVETLKARRQEALKLRAALSPKTINLVGKTWTAENVNIKSKLSLCYGKKSAYCETEGQLYTWKEARTICPKLGPGWRLPSTKDWQLLTSRFGGAYGDVSADKGLSAYSRLAVGGVGFNGSFGGKYLYFPDKKAHFFYDFGTVGYYWVNALSKTNKELAGIYTLRKSDKRLLREEQSRYTYGSVRCVKD